MLLVATFALRIALPLTALLGVVAAVALSNAALALHLRRGGALGGRGVFGILAADTVFLTALLLLAGGPSNPFTVQYLVHVALAAMLLGARGAWTVAGLSIAGYAALFLWHVPVPALEQGVADADDPLLAELRTRALFVAFVVSAVLVTHFVGRMASALAARERELAAARDRAARSDRLAAVATLAAGAAHELSTPLGTISVIAGEMAHQAAPGSVLASDAALIRAEVERCRAILDELSFRAGEPVGEAPAQVRVAELLADAVTRTGPDVVRRVRTEAPHGLTWTLPRKAVLQALVSLLRNALEASEHETPVDLNAEVTDDRLRLTVRDRGRGMDAAVLARAGEPYFTTKGPGKGMGLGLFLARSLAEQLGGALHIESAPGVGTTAVLELPRGGSGRAMMHPERGAEGATGAEGVVGAN
jgi:two-component system sensor histidine kinase RegB